LRSRKQGQPSKGGVRLQGEIPELRHSLTQVANLQKSLAAPCLSSRVNPVDTTRNVLKSQRSYSPKKFLIEIFLIYTDGMLWDEKNPGIQVYEYMMTLAIIDDMKIHAKYMKCKNHIESARIMSYFCLF
jgi:hypothetical protein